MTKRYTGGVVSSSLPTVNAAGASGVFLLSQQSDYQSRNAWPPYKVEKSLRFRNSASARLTRTPSVAGNKQIWTISFWLKTTKSNFDNYLFEASTDGGNNERTVLAFNSGKLQFRHIDGGSAVLTLETTQLFRDPSAWYHIVLAVDTTQATSSNRVKMYLNGSQITAFGTSSYPSQNLNTDWNGATAHAFGASTYPDSYADGYFSEIYNIDGQALTPSSFGATDKDGNWSPIAYTGTYGTNGFYLNFKDVTSAATTGYDYSGNGNNWTLSGFNVSTANTSYDSMIDVPEDQSDGTANNRGSYAVLNSLDPKNGTQSEANLTHSQSANDYASSRSTIGMRGGKWYWEARCNTTLQSNFYMGIGITSDGDFSGYNYIGSTTGGYSYDGRALKLNNNSSSSYGATYTNGDIIGVAFDSDNGTLEYYKNGVSQGVAFTGISTTTTFYASHWLYTTSITYNFGQRPFAYAPPTGFKALNTFNLPEPTIKQPNKQFDAVIWTGDQTNKQIPLNFTADFVWAKRRNNSDNHVLYDAIRGVNRNLASNTTDAEATNNYGLDFDNGNYLAIDGTQYFGGGGGSGITFVAWNWNAGGSTVTNTSGSITSQVRANQTAGFSIVTYTGNGVSGATVGHGLGVTPSMVIRKSRSNNTNWQVKHPALNANQNLVLNSTAATDTAPGSGYISAISSSTLTLLNGGSAIINVNDNGSTYVAYCFAPVAGYSAFGSYTGNGSTDGPFIYTGFRPRYLMIKRTDTTNNWVIQDTSRDTYNVSEKDLYADTAGAEATYAAEKTDILSNGFKQRQTGVSMNASGGTYIYIAFAETPFKYARSR